MTTLLDVLDTVAKSAKYPKAWRKPVWAQYVRTGDDALLMQLPTIPNTDRIPRELLAVLLLPSAMNVSAERFLRACIESTHSSALGEWLKQCGDEFREGCKLLLRLDCPPTWLATQIIEEVEPLVLPDGAPSAAGKYLLTLTDTQVQHVVSEFASDERRIDAITTLFARHGVKRWKALLEAFTEPDGWTHLPANTWATSLAAAPKDFLKSAARAFDTIEEWDTRFTIGKTLSAHDPRRFNSVMERLAAEAIGKVAVEGDHNVYEHINAVEGAEWLLTRRGTSAIPLVTRYLATWHDSDRWRAPSMSARKIFILDLAVETLGRDAMPLLDATFTSAQPALQLRAVRHWITFKHRDDAERIVTGLGRVMSARDGPTAAEAVRLAGELGIVSVEEHIWAQLGHTSRQVRDAAATTLATLGDSRLPKGAALWTSMRPEARVAMVAWLRALGTKGAIAALNARLDVEDNDDVRDAVLVALESGKAGAREIPVAELRERIARTLPKIESSLASWLNVKKLPLPTLDDGSRLSVDWLRYLLYRQSRVKEMRADTEGRALIAKLDRDTTGDLALAVVKSYFDSEASADDRWAMALAALVGDDRIIPVFVRQVKTWADAGRGKLAEHAAQALALLGTDAALVALDAMTARYASKHRNIGRAASDALAIAAEARGVTIEELGDLIVPWLGFTSGAARAVKVGKSQIEVRITSDFTLAFRDVATNKETVKLPPGASAAVQAEIKELNASLKEAAKSQRQRMETLAMRQFRWPRARWAELFLENPLLRPFTRRLVWGAYDKAATLLGTFRALDDGSLTHVDDDVYTLPRAATLGIVHPLELTAAQRTQWLAHFAEYDVEPMFSQLDRAMATVRDDQRDVKISHHVAETALHAMTFKGRAEQLGWVRGSVCDGGVVSYYRKTFPGADVDAFVETQALYVNADPYDDITLGKTFFVTHGSVQIGSYLYDEPSDERDSRLIAYGDVPPIAFSEAMSDLVKIAGGIADEDGA